jgi:hypothetical protein
MPPNRRSVAEVTSWLVFVERDLEVTQQRIRHFQAEVLHLRKVETNALAYRLSASGFLAEIDRMQLEVRD